MLDKTKKIYEALEVAFSTEAYLGDMQIVYDTSGYHLECNEVLSVFKGKKNVASKELFDYIDYNEACIFFLTGLAYRYYFPVFLYIFRFEMDIDKKSWFYETIIYSIATSKELSNFSKEQIRAIRDCISFIKKNTKIYMVRIVILRAGTLMTYEAPLSD